MTILSKRLYEPLDAEDVVEFHAARILLLLDQCGREFAPGRRGLANRAQLVLLDTILRFPALLAPSEHLHAHSVSTAKYRVAASDPRYREWLAYLECRGLILRTGVDIDPIVLTGSGAQFSSDLAEAPQWANYVRVCDQLRSIADAPVPTLRRQILEACRQIEGELPMGGQMILDLGGARHGA